MIVPTPQANDERGPLLEDVADPLYGYSSFSGS
jgi:hypothetical protein